MHFVCFGRGNSMHCLLRLRSLPTLSMVGTFGESRLHVLRTPSPFKTFRFEREALDGLCVSFWLVSQFCVFPVFLFCLFQSHEETHCRVTHITIRANATAPHPCKPPFGVPPLRFEGGGHCPKMFMAAHYISGQRNSPTVKTVHIQIRAN